MKITHQKGVAHIIIILAIVGAAIIGTSVYLVLRTEKKPSVSSSIKTEALEKDSQPNGTADNAANAAELQLVEELDAENSALSEEDNASEIDPSLIQEIEDMANEDNI